MSIVRKVELKLPCTTQELAQFKEEADRITDADQSARVLLVEGQYNGQYNQQYLQVTWDVP